MYVFLPINRKFLGQDMQHLMVRGNGHGTGGFNHTVDVALGDFALPNRHHSVRVHTANMAACNAGKNFVDRAIRHQLGFFNCPLDSLYGGVNIDHHALFKPTRRRLPHPNNI